MSERRNIAILAAAALVSLVLAGYALKQRADEGQAKFTPTEFFPGFAAQVKNAARIHILSKDANFDITYTPEKGWVLPQHGGYPADFDEVRHTLIGLAALQTIEPKTARPEWLRYIALETPPKGNGVLITVSDAQGKQLASLIAGNMQDIGDPGGASGLFVRRPNENQSWLARAVFVPHGEISAWVSSRVLDISEARLKDVSVTAPGRHFTLTRLHPSDQEYDLSPSSPSASAAVANTIPSVITDFAIGDVRAASDFDFSKPIQVSAHTFDGLTLSLAAIAQGNDVWVKISPSAAAGAPAAIQEEVRGIAARTNGWAYKLNANRGRLLLIDPNHPPGSD